MARVTELGYAYRPVWIWDVDRPVALGAASTRSDVMLVQVLINSLIPLMSLRDERKPFYPGPEDPLRGRYHGYPRLKDLVEDGICGKETNYAIRQFQKAAGEMPNGEVTPAYFMLGDPGTVRRLTIFDLNYEYHRRTHSLPLASEFPPLLRADLLAYL